MQQRFASVSGMVHKREETEVRGLGLLAPGAGCPPRLLPVSLEVAQTVYVDVHGSESHVPRWGVGEGLRIPLGVQHL